jgi:hypothetical protein
MRPRRRKPCSVRACTRLGTIGAFTPGRGWRLLCRECYDLQRESGPWQRPDPIWTDAFFALLQGRGE